MKNKYVILISSLVLTLILMGIINASNISLNETAVTFEQASEAINNSERIIIEISERGLNTSYMDDILDQAKKILEQAKYAEVLRNTSSSASQKNEANRVLALVNWKNIYYSSVMEYTDKIEQRKQETLDLEEKIALVEYKLGNYKKQGLNVTDLEMVLGPIKSEFYEEKYNEANVDLDAIISSLDARIAETARINVLKNSTINFIIKNWPYIFIFLIVLAVIILLSSKQIRKKLIIKKITRLKAEKQALNGLRVRTQTERFKENKISGLVYNIRTKKYEERIQEIDEELPVLEENLKKLQ